MIRTSHMSRYPATTSRIYSQPATHDFRRRVLDTVCGPVSALASRKHSSGEFTRASAKQVLGSHDPEEKPARRLTRCSPRAAGLFRQGQAQSLRLARVAVCEPPLPLANLTTRSSLTPKPGTRAKPEGHSLVGVEEQSNKYVAGVPARLPRGNRPSVLLTNPPAAKPASPTP